MDLGVAKYVMLQSCKRQMSQLYSKCHFCAMIKLCTLQHGGQTKMEIKFINTICVDFKCEEQVAEFKKFIKSRHI